MMVTDTGKELLLPRGLYDAEGACHRLAVLRALSGAEEVMLASSRRALLSTLLQACLERIGGYERPGRDHVEALTRGDRHFLALHLRAALFGDRISLVVACANPACAARADLELEVSALAPERSEPGPEFLEVATPAGTARLREPTGADDTFLAGLAEAPPDGDRPARSAHLWSRLVLDLAGEGALSPQRWLSLEPPVRQAIALGLAEGTSGPDLGFVTGCPSCGAMMELELDPLALLVRQLRQGTERLSAEVHCLAWAYGWSEADVLALPRPRRWRYLELVRRQVEGRPLLDGWG
jgi:hypothetical protein